MRQNDAVCGHAGCGCPTESGERFCSFYCERGAGAGFAGEPCECGHRECEGDVR